MPAFIYIRLILTFDCFGAIIYTETRERINLKTYEITAIAQSIIIMLGLVWYIWLVSLKKIETVVASWIVSTTALTLSLVTYFSSPNANWLGASLNASSVIAVGSTLIAVYIRSKKDGKKIAFNSFQVKCLVSSGLITILWVVVVWVLGGTGFFPNLLTQLLLIISYGMLIAKFWNAERNTESLVTWWCVFISSAIALYTSWMKHDTLAFIYALRSTVMCGILIYALHRINTRYNQNTSERYL